MALKLPSFKNPEVYQRIKDHKYFCQHMGQLYSSLTHLYQFMFYVPSTLNLDYLILRISNNAPSYFLFSLTSKPFSAISLPVSLPISFPSGAVNIRYFEA